MATFHKILLLLLTGLSLYYFSPQITPLVDKTIQEYGPKIGLNSQIKGAVTSIVPQSQDKQETDVSDTAKSFTSDVQEKIVDYSQKEIEKVKESASQQFCEVLVKKVKTECEETIKKD